METVKDLSNVMKEDGYFSKLDKDTDEADLSESPYAYNPLADWNYEISIEKIFKNIPNDYWCKSADHKTLWKFMYQDEYERFIPSKRNIGRRIQYIADRVLLNVYLKTDEENDKKIDDILKELLIECDRYRNKDNQYELEKDAITLIQCIGKYQDTLRIIGSDIPNEEKFENMLTTLNLFKKFSKEKLQNKYLQSLYYDYLALIYHKLAIYKIIECVEKQGKKFDLYALNCGEINITLESDESKIYLKLSWDYFNKTLNIYPSSIYHTFDGFARYNLARVQYLYCKIYSEGKYGEQPQNAQEYEYLEQSKEWDKTMRQSINDRKEWINISNIPNIIKHHLTAEYFHAVFELRLCKGEELREEESNSIMIGKMN